MVPLFEKVFGSGHEQTALAWNNLADLYLRLGQPQNAEPLFLRVLAIWESSYGPSHPRVALALNNVGQACHELGRYEEAGQLFERALAIRKMVLECFTKMLRIP